MRDGMFLECKWGATQRLCHEGFEIAGGCVVCRGAARRVFVVVLLRLAPHSAHYCCLQHHLLQALRRTQQPDVSLPSQPTQPAHHIWKLLSGTQGQHTLFVGQLVGVVSSAVRHVVAPDMSHARVELAQRVLVRPAAGLHNRALFVKGCAVHARYCRCYVI